MKTKNATPLNAEFSSLLNVPPREAASPPPQPLTPLSILDDLQARFMTHRGAAATFDARQAIVGIDVCLKELKAVREAVERATLLEREKLEADIREGRK